MGEGGGDTGEGIGGHRWDVGRGGQTQSYISRWSIT